MAVKKNWRPLAIAHCKVSSSLKDEFGDMNRMIVVQGRRFPVDRNVMRLDRDAIQTAALSDALLGYSTQHFTCRQQQRDKLLSVTATCTHSWQLAAVRAFSVTYYYLVSPMCAGCRPKHYQWSG